jgi:hypothetical protein
MAGPITIPLSVVYKDPLIARRANWRHHPPEGDRCISCGIAWATDGGASNSVSIDCSQAGTVLFSQVCALFVDNLGSDSDVTFVFPDTQFELTIPARAEGLWPVQTNSLSFYVIGGAPGANDKVYFQIYNSLPPPVSVMKSSGFTTSTAHAVYSGLTVGTIAVIPAGTSGIITALDLAITALLGGAAAGEFFFTFQDGNGKNIAGASVGWQAGGFIDRRNILSLTNLTEAFANGLNLIVAGLGTVPVSDFLDVNVFWR